MMTDGLPRMLIGGNWVQPTAGDVRFASDNPFTGEPWMDIPRAGIEDIGLAVEAAQSAFDGEWGAMTATARGQALVRLADLIARDAEDLARAESSDNGKLYAEMLAQVRYIPQWFRYFGGLADKVEGAVVPIDKPGNFMFTRKEPLGVIAIITPWNSPLLLATWKLAPALAAGNTIVWKPSEYSSASALAFARLFEEAGFPPGVVNIVTGLGSEIGDAIVDHPLVAKVAFTGGDAVGARIYQRAAAAIKPVTLELGGKSANIVFADADIDAAVFGLISGIFAASGQTCIAGSRALVHRSIYDEVVERLTAIVETAVLGDPFDANTQIGPVTTRAQLDKILGYIEIAKSEGARCVTGGRRASAPACGSGWFVEPTIFADVRPDMRIAQEEVFGPVLAVIPFDTEDEAIEIANGTIFGLAAGVWTTDISRALSVPSRLKAGTVWVNTYRAVSYMAPFGGYKRSGVGRESGQESINEFLQTKSVWINTASQPANPFLIR